MCACMHVYVHACKYVCVDVCMSALAYVYACVSNANDPYTSMRLYLKFEYAVRTCNEHMCVCMYVRVWMYICMYA